MMSAIAELYSLRTTLNNDVDFLCSLQAIQTQFFDWSVLLWTLCIATFLLMTVVFAVKVTVLIEFVFHLFVWSLSVLFTCLPLIGDSYGRSGFWCWIDSSKEKGRIWFWAAFYGPLWFIILLVAVFYTTLMAFMFYRRHQLRSLTSEPEAIRREMKILTKLSGYPLIFLLVWVFPTVNRIHQVVTNKPLFALVLLHVLSNTQGFLNCVLYAFNPADGSSWVKKFWQYLTCQSKKGDVHEPLTPRGPEESDDDEFSLN
ncbi:G-protein coupled receptor GCR1 [Acrasis kona]|uniref:G-protein coupled receptor GCR1 n=1 Tax=Acrasis kona TaxID=1008807 RepID=A0AAW2Z930_9EUKA